MLAGLLTCPEPTCRLDYPILDGVPVIVPDLRAYAQERGAELLLRDDLDPAVEGLLADAVGPGTWFDGIRQILSTYGWDGWADLDPAELPAAEGGPVPGAARRCLARLLAMAHPVQGVRRVLDLGCAAGRTSLDLAAAHPDALVLGLDLGFALLRVARRAAEGEVTYPRRRIGLIHDRRRFAVAPEGVDRADFWACDALALPFAPGVADLAAALNLLDCVPDPRGLLAALAEAVRPGGRALLATPYDWSARATPPETWIGGHSPRSAHGGAAEPFLRALVEPGAHGRSVPGLHLVAEADMPWQTRLHDRSSVQYRAHLVALARTETHTDD